MPPKKVGTYPKYYSMPKGKQWVVPVSWMLEQTQKHMLNGEHYMAFSSNGKHLYIRSYKPKLAKAGKKASLHLASTAIPGAMYYPTLLVGVTGDELAWAEDWPEPGTP